MGEDLVSFDDRVIEDIPKDRIESFRSVVSLIDNPAYEYLFVSTSFIESGHKGDFPFIVFLR
jgi:hypothetical protein